MRIIDLRTPKEVTMLKPYKLNHIDVWVDDYHRAVDLLAEGYGFPPEMSFFDMPWLGAWSAFSSPGDPAYASSELDMMGTSDSPGLDRSLPGYAYLVESMGLPPLRPGRTHSTTIKVHDLAPYLERLDRNGVPYRLDPVSAELPVDRLWVGWPADKVNPWYQPEFDAGLKLEYYVAPPEERAALTMKTAEVYQETETAVDRPETSKSAPDVRGFEAKTVLVRDLPGAIAALERSVDWSPERTWSKDGTSFAEFGFEDPRSAVIQLVSPSDPDSPLGRALGDWDYAPSISRIVSTDLDTREEALRRVGLNPHRGTASDGSGRDAIHVPNTDAGRPHFEFVEPKN